LKKSEKISLDTTKSKCLLKEYIFFKTLNSSSSSFSFLQLLLRHRLFSKLIILFRLEKEHLFVGREKEKKRKKGSQNLRFSWQDYCLNNTDQIKIVIDQTK